MYTSCTDHEVKNDFASFKCTSAPLRIVCVTVAFGLGVDSADIESYIQESGQAGRDGNPVLALLLKK